MITSGNFISEAYRDGQTYFFKAFYSDRQWSAEIWDHAGRICGAITCLPLAGRIEIEGLEDAVCEWVHRAIAHQVGICMDEADEGPLRQVTPPSNGAIGPAANAGSFFAPRSSATERRGADLRQESRMLIAQYHAVSERWRNSLDPR